MPRATIRLLVFCCAVLVVRASAAERPPVSLWFVDSLVKIFPGDTAGKSRLQAPEVWGARNQHASLQLAVRAERTYDDVTAEAGPLKAASGAEIGPVTLQPEGYVVVGSHTPDCPPGELVGEAPGWYPDPLVDFPVKLERRRTIPLWISVLIPKDAAPGIYRGTVALRAGKRRIGAEAFRVRVVKTSVPDERSLKFTMWFGLEDKVSRQFYGVPAYSEDWWRLIANYARVVAEHRQNVVLTPTLALAEPRLEGGEVRYDFSRFDRWVETFRKAGAIGTIEGGHVLDRAGSYEARLQLAVVLPEEGKAVRAVLPPDDPRVEKFLAGFLTALNAHLEEKGWKKDYLQHILDEAHGNEPVAYARVAALVRKYLPGVPTMDAVDASHMPELLQTNCDLWVPQLGRFDDQMELLRARMAAGHEVWYYTCLFPQKRYPNRLMDYPLVKVRLLHWLNFRYGFTGFLHWGGNYWTPDPVRDTQPVIDDNSELLPSGDAFIVYPDRERKSVRSSIRFETQRDGIEDYELLRLLKTKDPSEADRIARAGVSSFTEYVRDPAAFRRLERQLLADLSN